MDVLVTGGTGYVGRFIVAGLRQAGHGVTLLGRTPWAPIALHPWSLGDAAPELPAADALVHCAFDHAPGAYRGGEGRDPDGFWARNHDGSRALFDAAVRAGVSRVVFLSSRAVHADARRGEILRETDPVEPDTLYGRLKLALERDLLARPGIKAAAPRATGVYGVAPGSGHHKWQALFADYLGGRTVAPRAGTELHGGDLAAAVQLLLEGGSSGVFNASDILIDRRDLLARVRARTGCPHPLPARAAGPPPGVLDTGKLRALGWRPGGLDRLERFLDEAFLV
jgi:UDP-glucose 4-epimerase